MSAPVDGLKKKSYNATLDRMGYFCDTCGREARNRDGLVYFTSPEAVQSLTVCHDCLPDDFE